MSNKIQTYDDLIREKEAMQVLLKQQRELIRRDIAAIKEEFKPAAKAMSLLGKLTVRDHTNPLLDKASNGIIDLVLKNLILGRAGWITKLVVPFIAKNLSSHAIAQNKGSIASKILSILPFGKNGRAKKKESTEEH